MSDVVKVRCAEKFGMFATSRCSRNAIAGSAYCKQHDPKEKAERQEKRRADMRGRWDEELAAKQRQRAIEDAKEAVVKAAETWAYRPESAAHILTLHTAVHSLIELRNSK